jgi:1-acyl-sn-glycerol-3-phosphate acyltransferase
LSKIEHVATLIPRSDPAAIRAQVLAIAGELLRELGNDTTIEPVRGSESLEQELGLGSIERVELLSRLERSLGAGLPEQRLAEAKTLDDIITAIAEPAATAGLNESELVSGRSSGSSKSNSQTSRHPAGIDATHGQVGLLQRAWETTYGIYAAGLFFVWLPITWVIVLLMPRGRPAARMTSASLRIYFRLIGCRIHMEGKEHVDAYGACIYVSNHSSYSDVLAVMSLFWTNYHFVAKSEINDMPFIGTFLRKIGHFAFERSKLRARSRQVEQMEQALLRGESIFVFAEGTFTAQAGIRPFQLGAFRAAVKTGRPIVPVAVRGARHFLQDGTFLPKPSRITITVCPALFPAPDSAGREWAEVLRLRDETRRMISFHAGEPLLGPGRPQPGTRSSTFPVIP